MEAILQSALPGFLEMLHGSLWLYTCIERLAISIAPLRPYPLYKLQLRQLLQCFLHIKADPHLHYLTYIRLLISCLAPAMPKLAIVALQLTNR